MALIELEPSPARYKVEAEVFYSFDGEDWTSIGRRTAEFEVIEPGVLEGFFRRLLRAIRRA